MPDQNGRDGFDESVMGQEEPIQPSAQAPFLTRPSVPTLGGPAPTTPLNSAEAKLGSDEPVDETACQRSDRTAIGDSSSRCPSQDYCLS